VAKYGFMEEGSWCWRFWWTVTMRWNESCCCPWLLFKKSSTTASFALPVCLTHRIQNLCLTKRLSMAMVRRFEASAVILCSPTFGGLQSALLYETSHRSACSPHGCSVSNTASVKNVPVSFKCGLPSTAQIGSAVTCLRQKPSSNPTHTRV
jgi:hypothetical protein